MADRAGVTFIGYRELRDLMRMNVRETTAPTAFT